MGAMTYGLRAELFDKNIIDFSIDSRTVGAGELFFALSQPDYERAGFNGTFADDRLDRQGKLDRRARPNRGVNAPPPHVPRNADSDESAQPDGQEYGVGRPNRCLDRLVSSRPCERLADSIHHDNRVRGGGDNVRH